MRNGPVLLVVAVALAAFAMPAVANAQQLREGGAALAKGAGLTATSGNTATKTALGTLSCTNVTLHLTVVENNIATALATAAAGQVTTTGCKLNAGAGPPSEKM